MTTQGLRIPKLGTGALWEPVPWVYSDTSEARTGHKSESKRLHSRIPRHRSELCLFTGNSAANETWRSVTPRGPGAASPRTLSGALGNRHTQDSLRSIGR